MALFDQLSISAAMVSTESLAFVAPTAGVSRPYVSQFFIGEGEASSSEPSSGPGRTSASFGINGCLALAVSGAVMARSVLARGSQHKTTRQEKRLSVVAAFENELGVQPPVGFWDPAGFTADGNVISFKRRRTVELKHGRIAMLATMGYITPEITGKWNGYLSPSGGLKFADIDNGLVAVSKIPFLGWVQIVLWCGFCDISGGFEDYRQGQPGDYGWKVITSNNEIQRASKLQSEIANGRLAMFAILGMFFQDGLTGKAWGDWSLYIGSPLRAFENELGVQAPFGFWDPLGFTAEGTVESFRRRRSVELKHGRLSMLASIGYMQPELGGKWPGYLSPSAGLSFEDIPNGMAAIGKVPGPGWAQIAVYCGFVELSGGFSDYKDGTPGDYDWKMLTSEDPAERTKKLSAEIANGRLAMFAIIGMFFEDGLTGSAWGNWALYTASPLRAFQWSRV